jgi:uncharacterized metal-binding protein
MITNNSLYKPQDIKIMKFADSARLPGKDRIEEIKNYARISGIKRIGIAHCVAVQKEADMLKDYLASEFEVYPVNCKYGKIPASEIIGEDAKGISCNPSGQAAYLDENQTELNIVMGLCVGHDIVFTSKSKSPSTTLLVKDRQYKHNPMEIFTNINHQRHEK